MSERFASDQPKQAQAPQILSPEKLRQMAAVAVVNTRVFKINKKMVQKSTQEQLAVAVANLLAAGGKDEKVVQQLVKAGQSREYAAGLVGTLRQAIEEYKRSPEGIRTMVKKHRNQMIGGAVSFVIGIAITVGTFQLATSGGTGGYFFIFYGPVIWGIVYFITGLVGYVKYKGMDTSQQM